jgi:PAS domain S-box-containing protein
MSAAAEFAGTPRDSKTELDPSFENSPLGVAHCQRQGNITALNPALEQMLGGRSRIGSSLQFADLVNPDDRAEAARLLSELFDLQRDSFPMDSQTIGPNSGGEADDFARDHRTQWRQTASRAAVGDWEDDSLPQA